MPTIHRIPGLVMTDHEWAVPLDWTQPDGEQISVYAREVVAPGKEHDDLPWLVFFQGGPGGKSPRPMGPEMWIGRAIEEYRVLLLDQRGTGRSTPANRQTLARLGDAAMVAEYLTHFRADNIVRDAEHMRTSLLGADGRWSVLGQSFGGFCVTHYLSAAPEGLREAFITGGLPPLTATAEEIYMRTSWRVIEQNRRYFERYPNDQATWNVVAAHLLEHEVRLPNGERLSVRRLQWLGNRLGMSDGFEVLHYLAEEAFVAGADGDELSDTFLHAVMDAVSFAGGPLYALLHEACYAQGAATQWAAERVRASFPQFNVEKGKPFLFTGEMIYPWMFDEDATLQPLKEAADILAQHAGWPPLYDPERLRANTVPCAAVIYADDMYVERTFSEETAQTIRGCRVWLTNEYQHNGLRADGERVLGRLIDMVRGEV
jgi:pimeloyl-ACP methyl ester carboxylesterase